MGNKNLIGGYNVSKYMELVKWVREQIVLEKLLLGQKLCTEQKLSEMFQVSRQTVRHAIKVLEEEGIVYRIQGSGTYIKNVNITSKNKQFPILFITSYENTSNFLSIKQGMEKILSCQNYSLQIAVTHNQVEKERTILENIIVHSQISGILVEAVKSGLPNPNLHLYKKIRKFKIPILFVNSYYPSLKMPHIGINNYMVGKKAVEYLISKGHSQIGGVFLFDDIQGHQRYAGFIDAMMKARLKIQDNSIVWLDTKDLKELEKLEEKLLDRLETRTSIFCHNDEIAFSLIKILKKQEITIPEDISIISVDNSEFAIKGEVKLSTIINPFEKIGEKAAENIITMIKDPIWNETYKSDIEIIERDSVKNYTLADT